MVLEPLSGRAISRCGKGLIPIETIRAYLATAIASERPQLSVTLDSLDGQPFCGGFRNIVEGESAEVSLIIGEPLAWGRGIGQEAMALLMDFGFTMLGLTRIWLVVRAEHERGNRLFSGRGFTLEEVLANAVIVDGSPRDKWRMSIKKETWLLQKDA